VPIAAPPIEFDDIAETEIRNEIEDVMGNDDDRSLTGSTTRLLGDGAQRRPVQMIEMSVRYQHHVDRGQVADADARFSKPLEDKKPAGKIRIDQDVLATHLDEEGGMTDKSESQLAVADQGRLVDLAGSRSYGGVAH